MPSGKPGQIPTTEVTPAAEQEPRETEELEQPDQWKFVNRYPSVGEVKALIEKLPHWWGVSPVQYLDYIQGITNNEKVKVRVTTASGGQRTETRDVQVTTLYVAVAGRVQALQDIQKLNGWEVDFEPEPDTATKIAGYLELNAARIIYRELCVVRYWDLQTTTWRTLGRRPGTAWAVREHGSAPQMAETAARGRAIGAYGIGVLPGSGIASADEIRLAAANLGGGGEPDNGSGQRRGRGGSRGNRRSKDDLIQDVLLLAAQYSAARGDDELGKWLMISRYCQQQFHIDVVSRMDESGNVVLEVDLDRLREAHLVMMSASLEKELAKIASSMDGNQ